MKERIKRWIKGVRQWLADKTRDTRTEEQKWKDTENSGW